MISTSRTFGSHPNAAEVVVGKGVIDIPTVLKALIETRFSGHLALEFEPDANNPLPGIKESFTHIRKGLATTARASSL